LYNSFDAATAVATGTGVTLVAVYCPAVLEISELAVGLHVVAQRGTTGLDSLGQHRPDAGDEPIRAPLADRGGQTPGRNTCTKQRLADVDVAQSGNDSLIAQP
jgi:hypothetical protein